ncbi:MAG: coniferyl aldehyde dehydrogenase [Pseudomonadales bacterium]|nr:coniferyl aldehyde dehydrogenase [Pseudomonadales bacterium]
MNDLATEIEVIQGTEALQESFDSQQQAYLNQPEIDYEARVKDLKTLKKLLVENREALTNAICEDYGNRSWHESTFGEFIAVLGTVDYMIKRLKRWMKPQRRHVDHSLFPGGRNRVIPQPLGVVGIIVPWNFPINLSMIPIATAFAAGNRAMVKYSENSRALAKVLLEIVPKYFPDDKLAVFDETGNVGINFSKLPFDLLVFTGSSQTGKSVMAAAAQNLTPVLLELGGKSPAIIDSSYPLEKAVNRIIYAKQFNAGQVCLNVDYVFVKEDQITEFVAQARLAAKSLVPDINHQDYSSIIDERSLFRLKETLKDADAKGAEVINLSGQDINHEERKFPLHLVLNPHHEMSISQRETFGPILLVRTYKHEDEVVQYINSKERPLGLYVFSRNKPLTNKYLKSVMSGGVTVNDTMLHAFQDDLPFGGIGNSGMGHYHGREGFMTFSKLRPIFYQPSLNAMGLLSPPYPDWLTSAYNFLVKTKS